MKYSRAVSLSLLGTLFGVCAHGQATGIYLSASFDSSTRGIYAYASTDVDYATGYYYEGCIFLDLIWPSNGGYYGYESNGGYTVCSNASVSVDWSGTLPADSDWVDVNSYHQELIDYYTYQFDSGCYSDCYYPWDAYEMSLLGNDGGSYGSPQ